MSAQDKLYHFVQCLTASPQRLHSVNCIHPPSSQTIICETIILWVCLCTNTLHIMLLIIHQHFH